MTQRGQVGPDTRSDSPPTTGQWPAFQVFEQRREGEPYTSAGTVHAADLEMALLAARDVFARRPTCIGLWVAPATAVYRHTREQLADAEPAMDDASESSVRSFSIFRKTKQAGAHVFAGTVDAATPREAIRTCAARLGEAMVWWAVPEDALLRSRPEDVESMFAPARDKTFRDQASYHTVLRMHQIKLEQDARAEHDETKEAWSPWSEM